MPIMLPPDEECVRQKCNVTTLFSSLTMMLIMYCRLMDTYATTNARDVTGAWTNQKWPQRIKITKNDLQARRPIESDP